MKVNRDEIYFSRLKNSDLQMSRFETLFSWFNLVSDLDLKMRSEMSEFLYSAFRNRNGVSGCLCRKGQLGWFLGRCGFPKGRTCSECKRGRIGAFQWHPQQMRHRDNLPGPNL